MPDTVERDGGAPDGQPTAPTSHRAPTDWHSVEAAYVRGIQVGGKVQFPSLDEIAAHFGISRRQAAYHSRRRGWPAKREAFRTEFALESHRLTVQRRLDEQKQFDDATLTVAKVVLNKAIQALQVQEPTVHPPTLESIARTVERAQKIARVSTGLPTELIEEAEKAETRKRAMEAEAVAGAGDDPLSKTLERIEKLEGEDFLRAIDGLLGDTPAGKGQVIELKALLGG